MQCLALSVDQWYPIVHKMILAKAEGNQTIMLNDWIEIDATRFRLDVLLPPRLKSLLLHDGVFLHEGLYHPDAFRAGHNNRISLVCRKDDYPSLEFKIECDENPLVSVVCGYRRGVVAEEDFDGPYPVDALPEIAAADIVLPHCGLRRSWKLPITPDVYRVQDEVAIARRVLWQDFLGFYKAPNMNERKGDIYISSRYVPEFNGRYYHSGQDSYTCARDSDNYNYASLKEPDLGGAELTMGVRQWSLEFRALCTAEGVIVSCVADHWAMRPSDILCVKLFAPLAIRGAAVSSVIPHPYMNKDAGSIVAEFLD